MSLLLSRRSFLPALTAALPLRGGAFPATITISPAEEIGRISPLIYGHFTEHIGRLIYEGIWVGPDSPIANKNGFRVDTLRALERVRPSVFRWPGGCFADAYHWKDGVGPRAQRAKRRNHWWLRDEPNTFGTDEFVAWCEMLNAQPYLSVNVGSGSVTEAIEWLEYCNAEATSGYGAMRARNGRERPYAVKWWGIGNENWGCGGQFTAAEYAQQFRQYAVYFKRLGLTEGLQLVGVGHTADDWNRKFLAAMGGGLAYLDHLSIHRYFRRGHSTNFTDAEYTSLMTDLTDFETLITDALKAIDEVEPARSRIRLFGKLQPKPIGLIIDEWGAWHNDSPFEDGFAQFGVMRDALFAASCLNLFHKYASRITMTNIAQVLNCLQSLILTSGSSMILTPTYHVYAMYARHQGAAAVRTEIESSPLMAGDGKSRAAISASASKSNGELHVTLVNQRPADEIEVELNVRGARITSADAAVLTGPVRAQNTKGQPDLVSPKPTSVLATGDRMRLRMPAGSVVALHGRL